MVLTALCDQGIQSGVIGRREAANHAALESSAVTESFHAANVSSG